MADYTIETSSRTAPHVTSFEGFFRDNSSDVYRALFASPERLVRGGPAELLFECSDFLDRLDIEDGTALAW